MRCHFSDKDETYSDPSGLNIWTTNFQNPCVLESVENLSEIDAKPSSDAFSTLYSLDSVSQSSYKRKILDCEKEDMEERFDKIQRKRHMRRATSRANLVVDDDEDDDNELDESEICEQMELLQDRDNAMTFNLWKDNVDLSIQSINSETPFMYIPKLNLKEERLHLLRISMAKIRCVDDPETYLLRSVLINNTVKRLQKDVGTNYKCQPLAPSPIFYDSVNCENEYNNWDLGSADDGVMGKHNYSDENGFQYSRYLSNSDSINSYNYPEVQTATPYNFHLSVITPFSGDKTMTSFQNDMLQNSLLPKGLEDDENVYDPSFSYRTLRQTNPVHVYPTQPCGLQYRNISHEDSNSEYSESGSSSSLLDSVVYHSLIASLET